MDAYLTHTRMTGQRGECHHKAKLTTDQVLAIRARYIPFSRADGAKAIASEYNVAPNTIRRIVNMEGWLNV